MRIRSGEHGVNTIQMSTLLNPDWKMGYDAGDWYSYENENWLRFDENK